MKHRRGVLNFDRWKQLRNFLDTRFGQRATDSDFVFRGEDTCYSSVLPVIDRLLPVGATRRAISHRLATEVLECVDFRSVRRCIWMLFSNDF
jgi:hypothetical protein